MTEMKEFPGHAALGRILDGESPSKPNLPIIWQETESLLRQYQKLREAVESADRIIARAFICDYCGLMPEHVSNDDIDYFLTPSKSQTNSASQALKSALIVYQSALKETV